MDGWQNDCKVKVVGVTASGAKRYTSAHVLIGVLLRPETVMELVVVVVVVDSNLPNRHF